MAQTMTSRKTTKAHQSPQSFIDWLQQARQDFERFATREEQEAMDWITWHMPEEPIIWETMAQLHD